MMCNPSPSHPFLFNNFSAWHARTPSYFRGDGDCIRPKRAMVWNFPTWLFAADAQAFRNWERKQHDTNTEGCHTRMRAHAALTSLMFAGLQQGMHTGTPARRDGEGGGGGGDMIDDSGGGGMQDYLYMDPDSKQEWPMFEITHED